MDFLVQYVKFRGPKDLPMSKW